MSEQPSRLRQEQRAREEQVDVQLGQRCEPVEFASAEEMIRADRDQTPVPETLGLRVSESVAAEPPVAVAWWRRLLGS